MAAPSKKHHDTIMARAVMLPITNFNPGTPRLDGIEPRLKQMIAKSDSLDSQVRMFTAAFEPNAIRANDTRPEISEQTTAEVLTALDSIRRVTEYNARAKESRQFLNDTLKKYNKSGATAGGAERRQSAGPAPVAPMKASPVVAMEGVQRTVVAPTASMMNALVPTTRPAPSAAQTVSYPTTSNIDASRDPRRR
ncbi:unnamed protein product [Aureobasidium uvarum]|uniref:Uncharacterized protein n=1 Tax=Aureobasidium uvarum TaxID=2773716 RepID=A0A9N8KS14_9PEZI|nr:unnamed protein product [Aureobasidium uvarum]